MNGRKTPCLDHQPFGTSGNSFLPKFLYSTPTFIAVTALHMFKTGNCGIVRYDRWELCTKKVPSLTKGLL
jgi:hypothetical protein